MTDIPENPPAFPLMVPSHSQWAQGGMSLLDYFAGQALAGMLARPNSDDLSFNVASSDAYDYAHAMLAERAKSEPAP